MRKILCTLLSLLLLLSVAACNSSQTNSSVLTPIPLDPSTAEQTVTTTTAAPVDPTREMTVSAYPVPATAATAVPTDSWSRWPAESSLPWQLNLNMDFYRNRPADGQALQGITVILDPGHGGKDPGAVAAGADGSEIYEKDLNLQIAGKMEAELKALGAQVIMTRTVDQWSSLYQRIVVAGNASLEQWVQASARSQADASWVNPIIADMQTIYDLNDDDVTSGGRGMFQGMGVSPQVRTLFDAERQTPNIIYISVHCNSTEFNPDTNHGLQVYYCTNQSIYEAESASVIQQPEDPDTLPINPNYQYYNDEARRHLADVIYASTTARLPQLKNDGAAGVRTGNYAFIRETNLTAVLLECGYMSHPDNLAILTDEARQQELAEGLAEAVYRYFCVPDPAPAPPAFTTALNTVSTDSSDSTAIVNTVVAE